MTQTSKRPDVRSAPRPAVPRDPVARPPLTARETEQLDGHESFARFMERALYDPAIGYYSGGQVAFGRERHFETFVTRLTPLFGAMIAELARRLFATMIEAERVPDGAPLTVLELGAGNGDLAADALAWIDAHAETARWRSIAERVRWIIGEVSPALRERQRARLSDAIDEGRADVRSIDARNLDWEGEFYGLIFANELIDAFPCERLIASGPELDHIERVHVVASVPSDAGDAAAARTPPDAWRDVLAGRRVLSAEQAWERERRLRRPSTSDVRRTPLGVPLSSGWGDGEGRATEIPDALTDYLGRLRPLFEDLGRIDALPAALHWAPGLPGFVERISTFLQAPNRLGAAVLVDYGGSSRHVLDPRSLGPHLRVYGDDPALRHRARALEHPGELDITWDVDFTDLAHLAVGAGLDVLYYGHQSALECDPVDLWAPRSQNLLIRNRRAAGVDDPMQALMEAHALVKRFRQEGFWLMALAPPDVPWREDVLCADRAAPWREPELETLRADVTTEMIASVLEELELDRPGVADYLKPGGDPRSDLGEVWLLRDAPQILEALRARDWLRAPGRIDVGASVDYADRSPD